MDMDIYLTSIHHLLMRLSIVRIFSHSASHTKNPILEGALRFQMSLDGKVTSVLVFEGT